MYTMLPWKYSNSCRYNSDHDDEMAEESGDLSGSTNDGSDSEEHLREVEELLYSQIHFAPNALFRTDGESMCEVEDVVPGALRLEETGNSAEKKSFREDSVPEKPDGCGNNNGVRIDVIDLRSSVSDDGLVVKNTSKRSRLKLNKVDSAKLKVDMPSMPEKQFRGISSETPIVLDQTSDSDESAVDKTSGQPNESNIAKKIKKKKKKKKKQITSTPSNAKLPVHKMFDSESDAEMSSDAFCRDKSSSSSTSSLDLSSAEDDDIKVHHVQTKQSRGHSEHLLKDVLDSLPDCNWEVDAQDRCMVSSSRYYQQLKGRCNNCGERGHLWRDCPAPRREISCLLCGVRGHVARICPDSLCLNCHQPGHSLHCCHHQRLRVEFCRRCGMKGHTSMGCPDNWRQYHLTTGTGQLVKSLWRRTIQKFCYNCAASGHFGHECREDRADAFVHPNFPFVARYDDDQFQTSVDDRTDAGNSSRHSGYSDHWRSRSTERNRPSKTFVDHNAKNRANESFTGGKAEHSFRTETGSFSHKNKSVKSDVERLQLSGSDTPRSARIKSHNRNPSPDFERGHRKKDKARTGSQDNRRSSSHFDVKSQTSTSKDAAPDFTVQKHTPDGNFKGKNKRHSDEHPVSRVNVSRPKEDGDYQPHRQKTEAITNGGVNHSLKRKRDEVSSKSGASRSPSPWTATPQRPHPSCDRPQDRKPSPKRDIHLKTESQSSSPAVTVNGLDRKELNKRKRIIARRSRQKEKRRMIAVEKRQNEENKKIENSVDRPISHHHVKSENFDDCSTGDAKSSKSKTAKAKIATKDKQTPKGSVETPKGELRVSSNTTGSRKVVKTERGFRMTIDASKL